MSPGWRWVVLAAVALLAAAAALLAPGPVAAVVALAAVLAGALLARAESRPAEPAPEGTPTAGARPPEAPPPDAAPLIASLPCGVLLLDDDLTVLAVNDALARIVGHPLEEMTGVSLIRAAREIELVAFAREGVHGSREVHFTNGVEARLAAAPVDLPLAGGQATLLIAVEDVTALRAAQRARSDLVANLAHELRTPLAGARAIAETFQAAAEDPAERDRFLRLLSDEIERMSRLVERMLHLARLESGDEAIELEPLSPAELLERAAARVAPVAAQRRVRVEIEEAASTPVAGDREHVGEVLANLLDNALRHSPDDSRIALAALRRQRRGPLRGPRPGRGHPAQRARARLRALLHGRRLPRDGRRRRARPGDHAPARAPARRAHLGRRPLAGGDRLLHARARNGRGCGLGRGGRGERRAVGPRATTPRRRPPAAGGTFRGAPAIEPRAAWPPR